MTYPSTFLLFCGFFRIVTHEIVHWEISVGFSWSHVDGLEIPHTTGLNMFQHIQKNTLAFRPSWKTLSYPNTKFGEICTNNPFYKTLYSSIMWGYSWQRRTWYLYPHNIILYKRFPSPQELFNWFMLFNAEI